MKRWLLALVLLSSTARLGAADWQADFHPIRAGHFPPPRPQVAKYRFGWGAVAAAQASIEFSRQKKGELQLVLTTKTTGPVRALWQLDAEYTGRCTAEGLRPISLQQTERYRREIEKTKVDFTPTEVARLSESIPAPKTPPKTKRFEFPDVLDLQAALLRVRSQPLAVGERYQMVVYPARAAYLAEAQVVDKETIKVAGKSWPATKLQIALRGIDKNLALKPHRKFKNAFGWISDDPERLLLKVTAEVAVGSVWMELETVEFRDEASQRTQMPR